MTTDNDKLLDDYDKLHLPHGGEVNKLRALRKQILARMAQPAASDAEIEAAINALFNAAHYEGQLCGREHISAKTARKSSDAIDAARDALKAMLIRAPRPADADLLAAAKTVVDARKEVERASFRTGLGSALNWASASGHLAKCIDRLDAAIRAAEAKEN
jgi:hypothetical protein